MPHATHTTCHTATATTPPFVVLRSTVICCLGVVSLDKGATGSGLGWGGVCSGVGWVELGRTAVVDGNHAKTCPPRVVEGNGTSLPRLFVTLSRWPN